MVSPLTKIPEEKTWIEAIVSQMHRVTATYMKRRSTENISSNGV